MLKFLLTLTGFIFFSASAQACFDGAGAQSCGAATEYIIKIHKVEFCQSVSCANAVTVADSESTFDIAGATAGAAVGEYADLDDVPAGIYTHIRTTIDPEIEMTAGNVGSCAGRNFTHTYSNSGLLAVTNTEFSNNSNYYLSWNTAGDRFIHIYPLDTPVAISKAASLPQVQIDFSTSEAAYCVESSPFPLIPGPPLVNITVIDN